jgi:hypothetical protein
MKRKVMSFAATMVVALLLLTACGGGRDPHGLNGVWESRDRTLEFSGNRITELGRWREEVFGTGRIQITSSTFDEWVADMFGSDVPRDARFIESWQEHGTATYAVRIGYTTDDINGTFSISDDGRIEIVWGSYRELLRGRVETRNRGIEVFDFAQTENTFDLGRERFTRVRQ